MLIDEILVNLSESATAEHPEGCDCEECKKQAAEKVEECSEAHNFWTETGIDESEEKELEAVNAKMRKLMVKRSQCVSGSAKQEKINDELDKIYDRRHELMSKKTLNEDGEGTKVLEALEDINDESELNEKNFNCQKAEYGLKSGKFTCDGKDLTDELHNAADKAGKAAVNAVEVDEAQELYDTVTSALDEDEAFKSAVKGAYDVGKDTAKSVERAVSDARSFGKSVQGAVDTVKDAGKALKNTGKAVKDFYNTPFDIFEDSEKIDEYEDTVKNNAETGAGIGADIGRWIGKGLDKAKEYSKQAIDYTDKEFGKAREALYKDTANLREEGMRQLGCNEEDEKGPWDPENQDPEKRYMLDAVTSSPEVIEYDEAEAKNDELDESMYKVSKADGSSEYIVAESAEKFAEYINESFEDIVSFVKIDTKALNESMDHEIVDTVVAEVSKDKKASMGEIQSMLNDMVDDSMSEEFIKTIYNKIVNRLSDAGIEVIE